MSYKVQSWVAEEYNIGGLQLKKGDFIEVIVGRQTIKGTFIGFDKVLYAINIRTEDEDAVIPYKSIKVLKKPLNQQKEK